ncbi:kinase-like protein [Ceratobasidium sp. AG-Ba]|nr:kinase-like protein [Ceratobasidium sp. AG-Ba]
MSIPSPEHDILLKTVYHVFLPPKLPQQSPGEEIERQVNHELAALTRTAVEQYRGISGSLSQEWVRMSKTLSTLARHMAIPLDKYTLAEDMGNMKPGDVLALYIREQNAAVLVRKSVDATDFEVFEAQAPNKQVMSNVGKLVRPFPGPSIRVPNSIAEDHGFIAEISNFLVRMTEDPQVDAVAKSKKANSSVDEKRDVADPHYITQLFTGILRGLGDEIEPRRVMKRIADEVLWKNALYPWRRSPIWLIIRVAIQTSIPSSDEYKHFMAYLHAYWLRLCCNDSFSSDLLATMRIKMARRLLKIKDSAPEFLVEAAKVASDQAENLLRARWDAIRSMAPRLGPLNLDPDASSIQSLPNSRDYLAKVLNGRTNSIKPTNHSPNHSPRLDGRSGFTMFADGALAQAFKEHKHIALFDFESAVHRLLSDWVKANLDKADSCSTIFSCLDQYTTAAISYYTPDVADQSIMALTILELWVALDQLVTSQHSLLLEYSPDIPKDLVEPLLLRSSTHLESACRVQTYVRSRHKKATHGSVFSDKIDRHSFSVRFFQESQHLQSLKIRIEQDSQNKRNSKVEEMERLNKEHDRLMKQVSGMECTYRNDQRGYPRHKAKKCQKCKLKRQAESMTISVHEWPLPANRYEAEAAVFELQCPKALQIWRDATYQILCDLGGSTPESRATPPCILTSFDGLRLYSSSSGQRITLASSTKSFLQCHYANPKIPSTESSVCVPNGLTLRPFDSNGSTWVADKFSSTSFSKYGTFTLPNDSSYRYLQHTLEHTMHTSNQVLADQSDCPKELSLHEHYAFGTLRSGPRLQWMNIVRGLEENALTFSREEVDTLHTQAAWQIGVVREDGQTLDWHVELENPEFGRLLVRQASRVLDRVRGNWLESTTVHTIILLVSRLITSTKDAVTHQDAYKFLRDARNTTFSWLTELSLRLQNAELESQILDYQNHVCEAAAVCRSSYDVDEPHLLKLLSNAEDYIPLICSSVILQDNQPPTLGQASQQLQKLICRDRRLSFKVFPLVTQHLQHRPTLLDGSVSRYWSGYRPSSAGWTVLPGSNSRWITTNTLSSATNPSQQIHIDLLEGVLLINGRPLGRLPRDYVSHSTYVRLFGRKVLDVVPASSRGMVFASRTHMDGNEISLCLEATSGELVVQALRDGNTYELIPYSRFKEDFPAFFSSEYHHWINLDTGEVEFRPLDNPWHTSPDNWRLYSPTNSDARMGKTTEKGERVLFDIHSLGFRHIAQQLGPLELSNYLHVTWLPYNNPEIIVELPRMKLEFFLNEQLTLESSNFRGHVVDETQSTGTMFGLQNQLVLCAKETMFRSLPHSRSVLIPYGWIDFSLHKDHPEVNINLGSEGQVTFYQYKIDSDMGCLVNSNASLTSRLFKIYLHALTSHSLPDPLTGRTGTEEALFELDEAATTSFEQIDIEQAQLLKLIGELTPQRVYYPVDRKVMQTTNWARLPAMAQHYAFSTAANNVLERARTLQLFSPLGFDLEPYVVKIEETLMKRAAYRNRIYYPPDTTCGLFGSFGMKSSCDYLYEGRDLVSGDWTENGKYVAWASGLAYKRWNSSIYRSVDLVSQFEKWGTVDGPSPDLELAFSSDWLRLRLPSTWISIYNLARKAAASKNRFGLCICVSAGIYSGSLPSELVSVLCSFAHVSPNQLPPPPAHSVYQVSDKYQPRVDRLLEIINCSCRNLETTPSSSLSRKEYESLDVWIRRQSDHYKSNITQYKSELAQLWASCWPDMPSTPSDVYFSWFNVDNCMIHVRNYFESCSNNAEIQAHLRRLMDVLGSSPIMPSTSYSDMKSALPKPVCQKPPVKSTHNLLCFNELLQRPIRRSLLEIPLQHTITTFLSENYSPDTKQLEALLGDLYAHPTRPLCRRYGADMEESRAHLSCMNIETASSRLPPITRIESNRTLYRSYMDVQMGLLEDWLGPNTDLEIVAQVSGIWPRLTSRALLGSLAFNKRQGLSSERQSELLKYSRTYLEYQRSQRLMRLALEKKNEEFFQELNLANAGTDSGSVDPDWLLVQINGNFSIRTIQAQVSHEMISPSSGSSTVLQLNMGEGKSSVIVPIIAAALANGTRLVRVVVLKPLRRQMFHLLVSRLSGLVNRRIYYLPFGRHIRIGELQARQVQNIYSECMREGGILLVQPEHILSFKLMGIDQLFSSSSSEQIKASKILRETQGWLSDNARDILDESDEILHVRYQLVYTVGEQQPLEGHPNRWTTTQQVLSLVADHMEQLRELYPNKLKYEFRSGGQFPFIRIMPESSEIVAELIQLVAKDALAGHISSLNFRMLPKKIRKLAMRYITDRDMNESETSALDSISPTLRNGLLLLRGLLACGIITFALKDKHYRVDYGLHLTRSLLAVPYHAKDIPSLRAEFGHPDVAIVLTCLSYYNNGLTESQLDTCFELLYKHDNPKLEYESWTRRNPETPKNLRQLDGVNLKDREQFTKELLPALSRNLAVVDFFLSNVVFPKEAKQFFQKLSTSGWDLAEVKSHVTTGFSGTNDNRYLLPMSITQSDPVKQSSTNALVLTYLLRPENNRYLCIQDTNGDTCSTTDFIHLLLKQQPEIRVLLDVGAQMLELRNEDLVRYWLKLRPDIAAAVYFNDKDELFILPQNGSPTPFLLSPFSRQMDKCIVYLDDGHTRGTDLELPKGTRAAVTLGPKVTKDRLLQGCMRMRKLGFGHSVMFCAPPEIDLQIRKSAGHHTLQGQITTLDVIRWAMLETCRDLEHNISHWAQQGLEYGRRAKAQQEFSKTTSQEALKRGWVSPESRSLEDMYGVSSLSGSGSELFTQQALANSELNKRLAELGVRRLDDPSMAEEQEREVSHEVERERQVERPPKSRPASHEVDPAIKTYIQTGGFSSGTHSLRYMFKVLPPAAFSRDTWPRKLLTTFDFSEVIDDSKSTSLSDYMRPLHWILCGSGGIMIALSPYEVNELLPEIRRSKHVRLHVFTPRVTQSMTSFFDLQFYVTPSTGRGAIPLPKTIDRLLLCLFAGQLYFDHYTHYRTIAGFLGVFLGSEAKKEAEDIEVQSDGFVPESGRQKIANRIPEYLNCPFTSSPIGAMKDLVGYRRKGMDYLRTHLGQMLHARQLASKNF